MVQKIKSWFERTVLFVAGNYDYKGDGVGRGLKWIEEMRDKVRRGEQDVFVFLPKNVRNVCTKGKLKELFLLGTESGFDQVSEYPEDEEIFHFERSRFFDNSGVRDLVREGVQRMYTSIDPAHGWPHVRRVLQIAEKLWFSLREDLRPDWGAVLVSVVWHDVSRVDKLGPADDRWLWLKRIPGGQDVSIAYTAWRDAGRSALMIKRAAKRHRIPADLTRMVMKAIVQTANVEIRKGKKKLTKTSALSMIIHDADMLDLVTVGRIDDLFQNAQNEEVVDRKFYDRFIALFLYFILPSVRKRLLLEESFLMYGVLVGYTKYYAERFYPECAEYFIEAV